MAIEYRIRKLPEYKAEAREVVKMLNDRPHLMVRVEVSGEHFPHRDAPPFILIRTGRDRSFKDLFTEVSPDNQKLQGYLPVDIPEGGVIEFGYGDEIWGAVPVEFRAESVERLDKERLSEEIVVVDRKYVERMNENRNDEQPT